MSYAFRPLVRVHLTGTFKIELADGTDLTPTSAKAQALVALLVTSKTGERGRSWLISKLWSDRAPEQASGSLRQCLVQLRKSLGSASGLIEADRRKIVINQALVEAIIHESDDFLQGIEIRDEGFEDWLRLKRQQLAQIDPPADPRLKTFALPKSARKCVHVSCGPKDGPLGFFARQITDRLCALLAETFSVDIVEDQNHPVSDQVLQAEVQAFLVDNKTASVRMSLHAAHTGGHIWAASKSAPMSGAPPLENDEFAQLGNQLVEAVGDHFFAVESTSEDCPDTLCRSAIRNLFDITPASVLEADRLFATAYDLEPRGLYLAWRAQAKTIMMIERHDQNVQALKDEAEALSKKAMELEPRNSMVLATVANTYGQLFRSFEIGAFLAKKSVALNRANPMAWFALSSTKMYAGEEKEALRCAAKAYQLTQTSPYRFWWDSQLFGAALMQGLLPQAQHFAEQCHVQRPHFRPPLRYLIALYANYENYDLAAKTASKLQALEEDFSIDRLLNDRDYPASVLHRDIGIDLNKLASLT